MLRYIRIILNGGVCVQKRTEGRQPEYTAGGVSSAPNSAYLDALNDTAEDLRDLQETEKKKATKGDKIYITVMAVLNVAVLLFIGFYLRATGKAEPLKPIREEVSFDPAVEFYNGSAVLSDLKPALRGVKFPDGLQESFRALYAQNEDTVGWLRINGTAIDYVVVKGESNEKYERTDFFGREDRRASIWMDYRNTLGVGSGALSKVTILYGHHLSEDETIFAELENYRDVAYYKAHPVVEFNTIYNNYKWKVFACIVTNVDPEDDNGRFFYYWNPLVTDAETLDFCNEIARRSWFFNPAVDIVPTDKLLCLSTCTYMMDYSLYDWYDMRCVVMARLVRDGEDPEVDVSGAYQNENRRMPQLWYDQNDLENPYVNVRIFGQPN